MKPHSRGFRAPSSHSLCSVLQAALLVLSYRLPAIPRSRRHRTSSDIVLGCVRLAGTILVTGRCQQLGASTPQMFASAVRFGLERSGALAAPLAYEALLRAATNPSASASLDPPDLAKEMLVREKPPQLLQARCRCRRWRRARHGCVRSNAQRCIGVRYSHDALKSS